MIKIEKDEKHWHEVKHSLLFFQKVLNKIAKKDQLNFVNIEPCVPASNAVFQTDDLVIKIYPPQSKYLNDRSTEVESIKYCTAIGIKTCRLVSYGIMDGYDYVVLSRIKGQPYSQYELAINDQEKAMFAKSLFKILQRFKLKNDLVRTLDLSADDYHRKGWEEFSEDFNEERIVYIKGIIEPYVFVHGDVNPDNIIIDECNDIHLIDFGDSMNAPISYEMVSMICYLFAFEKVYIDALLNQVTLDELTEQCLQGILIHEFGANMVKCNLGLPKGIKTLYDLKQRIRVCLEKGTQHQESIEYLSNLS